MPKNNTNCDSHPPSVCRLSAGSVWCPASQSLTVCRKRGLYISFEGVDLTPDSTRGMINFLKNVSEVRFGPWFGDGSCKSQHVHFDIETLKEVIGSLKQSSCKTIEFCGNWKTTFCDENHRHVTPESVKVCARNLGWKYKICDVGLQIWEPNYPATQLPWEPFCHCRDKANRTCMYWWGLKTSSVTSF